MREGIVKNARPDFVIKQADKAENGVDWKI
jgi:hypothetical protein